MKKVLFVVDENMLGGVSIVLETILNSLDYSNLKVDVAILHKRGDCLNNLPKEINIIEGTDFFKSIDYSISEIIKSKNLKLLLSKIKLIFYLKTGLIIHKIKKERKKMNLDIYDTEIAFKDGFTAIFTASGNTKNKIHWLHSEYKIYNPNANYPNLFHKIFPTFNKFVAVSNGVKETFNDIYHQSDKTEVIMNPINTNLIIENSEKELNDNFINSNNTINFVSVGRLHDQKAYGRLIDVFNKLNNDGLLKNVILRIYGDGPEKDFLKEKITNYNLKEYVKLEGKKINPFPYLKNSDVFILSSIYEPFGLVIVEALTLKIPVLATSNSATHELIKDKVNGLIVSNDEEGLYNGLSYIIKNPHLITNMKLSLQDYTYNNDDIMKQIESLF